MYISGVISTVLLGGWVDYEYCKNSNRGIVLFYSGGSWALQVPGRQTPKHNRWEQTKLLAIKSNGIALYNRRIAISNLPLSNNNSESHNTPTPSNSGKFSRGNVGKNCTHPRPLGIAQGQLPARQTLRINHLSILNLDHCVHVPEF